MSNMAFVAAQKSYARVFNPNPLNNRIYGTEGIAICGDQTPDVLGLQFVHWYGDSSPRPKPLDLMREGYVLHRICSGFAVYRPPQG